MSVDKNTAKATGAFMRIAAEKYDLTGAILFGSRARGDYRPDSDADLALFLKEEDSSREDVAIEMAGIAFDVMLETGVLIEPLPLWEEEWKHPESFNNPALLQNIRAQGVSL